MTTSVNYCKLLRYILVSCMILGILPRTLMAMPKTSTNGHIEIPLQSIVSGTVTSGDDGSPLPGVNVFIKGTTIGTQTDFDGQYSIEVSDEKAELVFSYIGFLSQEITIGNKNKIDVIMAADVTSLDEVVLIGYGTMRKQDVTGAVSSVSGTDVMSTPVLGVADALKGRVAGMDITASGGSPGANQQIRIRGNRSLSATNQPLLVLDGVPYAGNINDINSNDVKSIEVLKDASSTAIYGSRGANGVILISTKRGGSGKTMVNLASYSGQTEIYGEIDARNSAQYVQQRIDVEKFYGRYTSDRDVFDNWEWDAIQNGVDTNWMDNVFNKGNRQNHELSFSGGNEKTQFLISAGIYNEEAVVPKGDYNRYTFRLNLDHQVNDWLKIGTSTNLAYSKRNNNIYENLDATITRDLFVFTSLQLSPLAQPYDENGELFVEQSPQQNNTSNPLAKIIGDSKDENQWIQVNPNIYVEAKMSDALSYRLNVAPSLRYDRNGTFESRVFNWGASPRASQRTENIQDFLLENIVNYQKTFGKHMLQATGLYSIQKNITETLFAGVQDVPYGSEFYNLGSASTITGVNSDLQEWGLASVMGRMHYSYNNKYLFTATLRADGSSRLSKDNKWGYFPSAAFGWNISEEDFMKESDFIDNLKLRTSFGRVGNTGIAPYQTQGSLSIASYNFGPQNVFGYSPTVLANPDLSWEMTNTFNLGLDFSMANGRFSGSVEFYKQYTSDLILNRQLPPTSGFDAILENIGKTENSGFEITLNTSPISSVNGFNWSSDLTASRNQEKIVNLYNSTDDDIGNRWFIGKPINSWFYYEDAGVWQLDEAVLAASYNQLPGSTKIKDQNNDGRIDADDRVVLGTPTPNWVLGWNNTFNYKNLDLTVFAVSRLGHMIFNGYRAHMTTNGYAEDIHNGLNIDYWTPDNPINSYPTVSNHTLNDFPTSKDYHRGDFFKIRDLTLGYTLNQKSIPGLPFQRLRIYGTANNAIIFKKKIQAVTIDTENDNGNILVDNQNRIVVPPLKALIFGVNINF